MCDKFFDDSGDEYDGEPGDYGDDGFSHEGFQDNESGNDGEPNPESDDGSWDGIQWQDWMIIGPLSEEIARKKRERNRIRRKNGTDDYRGKIEKRW